MQKNRSDQHPQTWCFSASWWTHLTGCPTLSTSRRGGQAPVYLSSDSPELPWPTFAHIHFHSALQAPEKNPPGVQYSPALYLSIISKQIYQEDQHSKILITWKLFTMNWLFWRLSKESVHPSCLLWNPPRWVNQRSYLPRTPCRLQGSLTTGAQNSLWDTGKCIWGFYETYCVKF